MADVGAARDNGAFSARKRRETGDNVGGNSPIKRLKLEDDEPPQANPNTLEAVRDRNKAMALDLQEKNRRIAFLTHKCESLYRQSAISDSAFRCIQRQWVQLLDDLRSACGVVLNDSQVFGTEWADVIQKTQSLGVLRLPRDAVSLALPEWFLAISRGDDDVDMPIKKEDHDEDEDEVEVTTELLRDKQKQVENALRNEQSQMSEVVQRLLQAIDKMAGGESKFELKQLVDEKRQATSEVLALKDEVEAIKRKLEEMQSDLEYKEAERHRACRDYDRLRQYFERTAGSDIKTENGANDDARDDKQVAPPGEKRVTLLEADIKSSDTKSSVDREAMKRLQSDKNILVTKLKEERQKTEAMRCELNRLQALEEAWRHEESRLRQEHEAQVARLQDESANAAEQLAMLKQEQAEQTQSVQNAWQSQLDKAHEEMSKGKAKLNELLVKNTALRDKLSSWSGYRDQLMDLKLAHESLKREAERLKEQLRREKDKNDREVDAERKKETTELRERLSIAECQRDDLRKRLDEVVQSQSADDKLQASLRRESSSNNKVQELQSELAAVRTQLQQLQVDFETAVANHDALKDENDALLAEIENMSKEGESIRHSKKKVIKQLEEKRQAAKKLQSELAKECDAKAHLVEEMAAIRLQVSSLKYVHKEQKATLEASKQAQSARDQELDELQKLIKILQSERDNAAIEKIKAEREADVAKQMFKAEAAHKNRQLLQDKSRPCERCEKYRAKEVEYEKKLSSLKSSRSSDTQSNGLSDLERFELQDLQKQLKCSVCQDRHKNVIISKCFHMFCKECVDSNLKSRNRKCPTCKKMFGQDDVKNVWFT